MLRREIEAGGVAPVDLSEISTAVGRNVIAAEIINRAIESLCQFQQQGFAPFMAEWRDADALAGKAVRVLAGEQVQPGIARGIDAEGALMLETPTGLMRFISGEVSVRAGAS